MRIRIALFLFSMLASLLGQDAQFNEKGELLLPPDYREWIYLSSGLGMNYQQSARPQLEAPFFDSVFVNPAAWKEFKKSGVWPEGSIFILEIRYSSTHGSINKAGFYQSDIATIEASVKDSKRFDTKWGYFNFGNGLNAIRGSAPALPKNAGCLACHTANAAVELTFSQFYPLALNIAESKATLKSSYLEHAPAISPPALAKAVREAGWPKAQMLLAAARAKDPKASVLQEANLNLLGYAMLQEGKKSEAEAILMHVSEQFPQSANAWDSLAEVLEANGKKAEALLANQKLATLLASDNLLSDRQREQLQKLVAERATRLQR